MRVLLAVSSVALLAACGQSAPTQAAAAPAPETVTADASAIPMDDAKVVAVLSYADWCGSCKALDPKIEAVRAAQIFDGVVFARIDYTDRDADAFFASADALGAKSAFEGEFATDTGDSFKIKTGKLYLISTETGNIIARVDKTMDEAAITAAITDAAA